MYYVYELVNLLGTVEYVGQTIRPKIRFYEHTTHQPSKSAGKGRFLGRQDISMHIVGTCATEAEALQAEYNLQIFWDLPTDRSKCGPRGENAASAKLTETQVKEIKKLLVLKIKQRVLADLFNVSVTSISNIKKEKTWSHVTLTLES